MESPLISIVKGNPSPEELAALVAVLLARAGQTPAAADAYRTRGRASWQQRPAWKSPAAWAAARRRWDAPCRRPSVRLPPWPTTERSAARAHRDRQHALTAVRGEGNGNVLADSCELSQAVVPLHLVDGAANLVDGAASRSNRATSK
ncbi:MAG: Acyl-CoA carboxylase epsilon subunit [Frankiales bacterium]|nr:Acyl-CoA carboxylase epsilon subunit [Frankiales bacterium]